MAGNEYDFRRDGTDSYRLAMDMAARSYATVVPSPSHGHLLRVFNGRITVEMALNRNRIANLIEDLAKALRAAK